MTPEQKTEETKLERLTERFEPVVRRAFPGTATNHFEALLARCSMNDDERLQETRGFARALERARNDAAQKVPEAVAYFSGGTPLTGFGVTPARRSAFTSSSL